MTPKKGRPSTTLHKLIEIIKSTSDQDMITKVEDFINRLVSDRNTYNDTKPRIDFFKLNEEKYDLSDDNTKNKTLMLSNR